MYIWKCVLIISTIWIKFWKQFSLLVQRIKSKPILYHLLHRWTVAYWQHNFHKTLCLTIHQHHQDQVTRKTTETFVTKSASSVLRTISDGNLGFQIPSPNCCRILNSSSTGFNCVNLSTVSSRSSVETFSLNKARESFLRWNTTTSFL